MKKKVLMLIMVVISLFVIAACESEVEVIDQNIENEYGLDDDERNVDEENQNADGDYDDHSVEVNENEYEEELINFEGQRGVWNGNTFINEYSGITFTLPANWTSLEVDAVAEFLDEDLLPDTISITEFMAMHVFTGEVIELSYTNTWLFDVVGYDDLFSSLVTDREIEYDVEIEYELVTQLIGDEEFFGLTFWYDWEGEVWHETTLVRRLSDHYIVITVISEDAYELINYFDFDIKVDVKQEL